MLTPPRPLLRLFDRRPGPRRAPRRAPTAAWVAALLIALAGCDAGAPPADGLGGAPEPTVTVAPDATRPAVGIGSRELDWYTRIEYGTPSSYALVVHDSGADDAFAREVARAFAQGLAWTDFAVDIVSVGEMASLGDDYDLLVFVTDGRRRFSQEDVVSAIGQAEIAEGMPAVVIAAGQEPLLASLRAAELALGERGAYLVDAAAFVFPPRDWEGPEDGRTMAFVTNEAEQFGICVGEMLLE